MCCGSRRAAWSSGFASTPRASSAGPGPSSPAPGAPRPPAPTTAAGPAPQAQGAFPTVLLAYAEARPMRVRGPVTGRPYAFAAAEPPQAVDARDAAVLTRNRAFRPA
jgi:hypothetical protein